MDSSPGHSLPPNAPFQYTITIIHFIVTSIAFIGCYPYALTQSVAQHSHKRRLISLGVTVVCVSIGFVTACFINYSSTDSPTIPTLYFCLTFCLFCLVSLDLILEYISMPSLHQHQHHHEQQTRSTSTRLYLWAYHLPKLSRLVLTWVSVCLGYFYWILGVMLFTSTCESLGQCGVPLATGSGFILSGSLALLYLVGILVLPHCPEYYEAFWILVWGCLSFLWWDAPVVGSLWKGVNFGLLWTTGGLLSLVMTFQTWLPFLQKRNIVNSVIICLTGKGILSGHSEEDAYAMDLQTTLGTILIIGALAKCIQIMLRKTGTDNVPRLYSRILGTNDETCDDDDTCVNDLDVAANYESTYRQLTGTKSSCKHQSVYASITMLCGLLSCFATISAGFFFIGGSVEWVQVMRYYISDSITYVNLLLAMVFLWIGYVMILCSIYKYSCESADGYDYLGVATGDYQLPVATNLSPSLTASNFDAHNAMTTPTSSTSTTYDHTASTFTTIPLDTLGSTKHSPTPSTGAAAPIRPSQYRAKRRSLLISTNKHHDNGSKRGSRTLSLSSHTGVGGVLPDDFSIYGEHCMSSPIHSMSEQHHDNSSQEALQQQQHDWHSPTFEQQSWQHVTSPSPLPHVISTSSTVNGSAEQQAWTPYEGGENTNGDEL